MKLVRLYQYNYIENTSLSCDVIDGNKLSHDNSCLSIYNKNYEVIEQEYMINGKKYVYIPSLTSSIGYNLLKDEQGILKKFVYDKYNGRHIEDAGSIDFGHNIIKPNDGEINLFKVEMIGSDIQNVIIDVDDGYFVAMKDENHAVKMHYERKDENSLLPLIDTQIVTDEEYSIIYANDNSTVFFISQTDTEKCIMNLRNSTIETLALEKTMEFNPFLRYRVTNKNIQYDDYNEPIQIDGISTVYEEKNQLLLSYAYTAYDRFVEDYKYTEQLKYIDHIKLDQDLEIPVQFYREVYIDNLNQ